MKLKHIKNNIALKNSKGCTKGRLKNNRVIYKTQKQIYKEGMKDFKESLPDRDFKGLSKDSLMKYKEKYKKAFKRYPSKNMSIYDIKKSLQDFEASKRS